MGIVYKASVRTARLQAVLDGINAGAAAGTLEIGTAAWAAVIAIFTLVDPAGSVSGDVLTIDMDPDIETTVVNGGGTPAVARVKDSDGNVVIDGLLVGTHVTVTPSGAWTAGQTVRALSMTLTHPST